MVVVGIVDRHGLVRLIARRVARKARELLASGSRWAVMGDLVDLIACDGLRFFRSINGNRCKSVF